jgi:AraC-like DNA-binding protein
MTRTATRKTLTAPAFRRLCVARDLLAELQAGAPSVTRVARACELSPFQLIRGFEALFGSTPLQFRTQLRVERAKLLLSQDRLSVTEVCFAVGFSSLGSFSALFARRVGASPTAYRHRLRSAYPVPADLAQSFAPGCLGMLAFLPAHAFCNFREAAIPHRVVREGQSEERTG